MNCIKRVRNRDGRCYELSGRIMLEEPGAEAFLLIHGTVNGSPAGPRGVQVAHAWVLCPDGTVYDAVGNERMSAAAYRARLNAVETCRYTKLQVARLLSASGHWGSWEQKKRAAVEEITDTA